MRRKTITLLGFALLSAPPAAAAGEARPPAAAPASEAAGAAAREIEALLAAQAGAWNRGDLEAFCAVYEEDALFVSPSGTTRGRRDVLDRYRKRYPDAAARGTLSFEILDAREVGTGAASLAARWRIEYDGRPAVSGSTILVLRRTAAGWRIVHDASM